VSQAQWLAKSSPTDPRHGLGSQDMAMVDPFGSRSVFIDAISA
jgi:hypothetical protein